MITKLTTEIVKRYEGGQLITQNKNVGWEYIYRGEIVKAWVDGDTLRIEFKWRAKKDKDGKWYALLNLDYSVDLKNIIAHNIGDRIDYDVMSVWDSKDVWESGTFYLSDDQMILNLTKKNVIGLQTVS
jgi:hypothetical protein